MARQKTVFNNEALAKRWAQQTQEYGRNSGETFYFRGPAIYSWGSHFLAGLIVPNDKGEKCALLSNYGYSMSTSRHEGEIWYATHEMRRFTFYCALNAFTNKTSEGVRVSFSAILAHYQAEIDKTWAEFKKGWKSKRIYRIQHIMETNKTANEFIDFFNLDNKMKLAPEVIRYIIEVKMGIADEQL